MNQELDIHRQHAAERLRADTMTTRFEAKTKECNALRDIIAKLNEQLSDCMVTTQNWASLAGTNSIDAERYRAWRDCVLSENPEFIESIQNGLALSTPDSEQHQVSVAEWDAAIDFAIEECAK